MNTIKKKKTINYAYSPNNIQTLIERSIKIRRLLQEFSTSILDQIPGQFQGSLLDVRVQTILRVLLNRGVIRTLVYHKTPE